VRLTLSEPAKSTCREIISVRQEADQAWHPCPTFPLDSFKVSNACCRWTNRGGPKEGLKTFQRPTRWNFAVITSLLRAFRLWTRDRCSTMMVKMAWDRLECWFIIVLPVVRNMEPYSKHLYKQAHHPVQHF
jgi:hypothetical protein